MRRLPDRIVVVSGVVGAAVSLLSTAVSMMSATGSVPAFLFGRTHLLTTFTRLGGVPLEFLVAVAFCAWLLLASSVYSRDGGQLHAYGFIVGVLLLAGTGTIALGRPHCIAHWLTSACAAAIVGASALADGRPLRAILREVARDAQVSVSQGRAVPLAAVYVLAVMVLAQGISHRVQARSITERSTRDLHRWFSAQKRSHIPELQGGGEKRRLVVFTDYQCSVCSTMVPQYRAVLAGLLNAGHDVEFVVKDFPLEPECNGLSRTAQHPMACEAAAAMRLLKAEAPGRAADFESWLYQQRDRLTNDSLTARLRELGIADSFSRQYKDLVTSVAADAKLGQAAGVLATPTLFLDGVKLPALTPPALEGLLANGGN